MKEKFRLIFILGLFSLLLTACGAQIHTETSFAKDGSGQRIVYLKIASKDEGKISGGFDNLDQILEENAPSFMEINRYEDTDANVMVYELKYDFSDIDELKEKTAEITGEACDAAWEQEQGAFQGAVTYSESTSTSDLIQWVKDALKEESISSTVISQVYEEEDSQVSYEGETVWTGKENAEFTVDLSPTVKEVSVYTIYDEEGGVTKQIKLSFNYSDYLSMDTEEGLNYLQDFSENFKVDSTCNGYSVTLNGEDELKEFFSKASGELDLGIDYKDLDMGEPDASYYFEDNCANTIFSNQIEMKEVYNLNTLLAGFKVSATTIKDYVSIPERDSYTTELIHHTYALESNQSYNYIGEYDIKDTYYLYFQGGESVELNSAAVVFSIDENLVGTQTVTILLTKNGMEFTSSQVMEYYSTLGEKVQYQDDENTASITFSKEINYNKDDIENEINRVNTFSLYKLKYEFGIEFSMEPYYADDSMTVRYTLNLPVAFQIDSLSFGDERLNSSEIKQLKDNEQWTYTTELSGDDTISIEMVFSRANMIFYGILCISILLVIGTLLSVYFYVKGKKKIENETKERGR